MLNGYENLNKRESNNSPESQGKSLNFSNLIIKLDGLDKLLEPPKRIIPLIDFPPKTYSTLDPLINFSNFNEILLEFRYGEELTKLSLEKGGKTTIQRGSFDTAEVTALSSDIFKVEERKHRQDMFMNLSLTPPMLFHRGGRINFIEGALGVTVTVDEIRMESLSEGVQERIDKALEAERKFQPFKALMGLFREALERMGLLSKEGDVEIKFSMMMDSSSNPVELIFQRVSLEQQYKLVVVRGGQAETIMFIDSSLLNGKAGSASTIFEGSNREINQTLIARLALLAEESDGWAQLLKMHNPNSLALVRSYKR